MTNLNRKERWCVLLENNIKLYQSIQNCVGIYSKQDLSNFIFNLYSELSNKIHNPQLGIKAVKICGEISVEEAQVIACICNQLQIRWESDLINQKLQIIKERLILNRSFTVISKHNHIYN